MNLRPRAVCGVANARNSYGYCCALRLAAHPDPQSTLSAQFVQRIPSELYIVRLSNGVRKNTHATPKEPTNTSKATSGNAHNDV